MESEAGVVGITAERVGRRGTKPRPVRARAATCWDELLTMPVEVTAPDRESASALLGEAVSHFRAELVETDRGALVVRLGPAGPVSAGWVFELLALIERWLEALGLQVANVHHGHRSYVITAPPPGGRRDGSPEPASAA